MENNMFNLSGIKTEEKVDLLGQVFEDDTIKPLADALRDNEKLSYLDISYTNFTDSWFTILATELLKKTDEQLGKLSIMLDNTLITDRSLKLLKALKLKLHKLEFSRSEFFSPDGLAELLKVKEEKAPNAGKALLEAKQSVAPLAIKLKN
jgi:hypothetical protein